VENPTPSLPTPSPEDKARLIEEAKAAAKIIGGALGPALLTAVAGGPVAWAAVLWPIIGAVSKLITPADVALLLNLAVAAGKISVIEAKLALLFVQSHAAHPDPRIDPNDPATWALGAPPMSVGADGAVVLHQTPVDPLIP